MKLNLSKIFDPDSIIKIFANAKIEGVNDFVTGISDLSDKVIALLRGNVSIADNIDCQEKDVDLIHNKLLVMQNPSTSKTVRHIAHTRAIPFDNPVTAFAWQYNAKGNIEIKAQFTGAPSSTVQVRIVMYF